jgi:hypothetical protein
MAESKSSAVTSLVCNDRSQLKWCTIVSATLASYAIFYHINKLLRLTYHKSITPLFSHFFELVIKVETSQQRRMWDLGLI